MHAECHIACLLTELCLSRTALCAYITTLLILHFLWVKQHFVCTQQCLTHLTLYFGGTAYVCVQSTRYLQHCSVVFAGSICRWRGPVHVHYDALLFLIELALKGVAEKCTTRILHVRQSTWIECLPTIKVIE